MRLIKWIVALLVIGGSSPVPAQNPFGSSATALRGWRLCNPIGTKTDGYVLTWDGTNTCWKSAVGGGGGTSQQLVCANPVGTTCTLSIVGPYSCADVDVPYTFFTGGASTQEVKMVTAPAGYIGGMALVGEPTKFLGLTTLVVSMQVNGQHGVDGKTMLTDCSLQQSTGGFCAAAAAPNTDPFGAVTQDISMYFTGTGGTFSSLSAGGGRGRFCVAK